MIRGTTIAIALLGMTVAAAASERCYLLLSDCVASRTPECESRYGEPKDAERLERCLADCNLCETGEVCTAGTCCPLERACAELDRCCPEGDRCSLDGECVRRSAAAASR